MVTFYSNSSKRATSPPNARYSHNGNYIHRAILERFGTRIAKWTLLFLVCGCGMFVSSSAFLPSTFSMCFTMLALGAWYLDNYAVWWVEQWVWSCHVLEYD